MAEPIHIGCQADHRFAPDCAVMLRSLLRANPADAFEIHFLHGPDLPEDDLAALRSVVEGLGARWSPVPVTAEHTAGFPSMPRYGGLTAWYRLLLPRLVPQCDRILYLDADLLIVGSVRPLWELDLGGAHVAAVTNPVLKDDRVRVVRDLGLPHPDHYFNSGVMLLDLAGLRSTGLMDAVEQVVRDARSPMPWADQEPLNAVLWSHRHRLHPRWNLMNPCYDLPARQLPWSKQEVADAVADPAVVHFIGSYKAWHHRLRHPHRATWFEHLAATPYAGRPIEGRTWNHRLLRPLPPRVARWIEASVASARSQRPAAARAALARRLGPRQRQLVHRCLAAPRAAWPGRPADDPLGRVLRSLADTTPELTFVQVGANDATHGDPLRALSRARGWRGLLVEPVPFVFERLCRAVADAPGLTPVNLAVGSADGWAPFHHVEQSDDPALPEWYDQIGSFSRDNVLHPYHVSRIPDLEDRVATTEVERVTFDTLWARHGFDHLDLLHIDAEGHDDEILATVDLASLRPRVVLYEHKHLPPDRRAATEARLLAHGYDVRPLGPDSLAVQLDGAPLALRLAWRRVAA